MENEEQNSNEPQNSALNIADVKQSLLSNIEELAFKEFPDIIIPQGNCISVGYPALSRLGLEERCLRKGFVIGFNKAMEIQRGNVV